MSSAVLAALIAAGSAIATNERSAAIAKKQVDEQNEYNSPESQMQRLQNAGINPSGFGMGSNGLGISGNTSAIPNMPHLEDPMASFANTFLQLNQGKLSGAQTKTEDALRNQRVKNVEAECENLVANTAKLQVDAVGQKIVNDYTSAQLTWVHREKKASLDLTYAQIDNLNKGTHKLANEIMYMMPAEYQKLNSETKLNFLNLDYVSAKTLEARSSAALKGAEKGLAEAQTGLVENQQLTEIDKQHQMQAETELTEEEVKMYSQIQNKILEKYDAEISKLAEETKLTKEQVYWYIFDEMNKYDSEFMGMPVGLGTGLNRGSQRRFIEDTKKRRGIE